MHGKTATAIATRLHVHSLSQCRKIIRQSAHRLGRWERSRIDINWLVVARDLELPRRMRVTRVPVRTGWDRVRRALA